MPDFFRVTQMFINSFATHENETVPALERAVSTIISQELMIERQWRLISAEHLFKLVSAPSDDGCHYLHGHSTADFVSGHLA
jgi:hypothetical protein